METPRGLLSTNKLNLSCVFEVAYGSNAHSVEVWMREQSINVCVQRIDTYRFPHRSWDEHFAPPIFGTSLPVRVNVKSYSLYLAVPDEHSSS
jgi:hypothetical protein